jgi:tetratricopeptide (TPR) repeat protein
VLLLAAAPPPAMAAGCTLGKLAELPVTMDGLLPIVPAKIDGVDMKLEADSGSFFSLLTPQATTKAHLHPGAMPNGADYVVGLAGIEHIGLTTVKDFSLAGHSFQHADFIVGAPQLDSEGIDGLLGGNFLSFADVEFDFANGAIRMFKPLGCGRQTNFAYWAGSNGESADITPAKPPANEILVSITVNGHVMKALLDSGAGRSFITRAGAKAAGVSVTDASVKPGGVGGGIGHSGFETWIARFDSFALGDELVKNAMLRIGDTSIDAANGSPVQMLIGADFLLSHRVYVANSEAKLYFTYIGGPVFNLDQAPGAAQPTGETANAAPATAPAIPGAPSETPVDAAGFERRAAAYDARHDWTAAIADYTRAIALAPTAEHDYYERGLEHWRTKEAEAALADLTAALKLKPDDDEALLARGDLRLQAKDEIGAAADFDAAAKVKPGDRLVAAMYYQGAQLFEQAVAQSSAWIADHPKDPELAQALNNRCWARALWNKELDQALADCNAAIQKYPGVAGFRDSRGLVYLRLGQYQASIADYDAALKAAPKQAWSLYGRGIDKLRLGRKAEGDIDVAAAVALAPNLPETAKGYGIAP